MPRKTVTEGGRRDEILATALELFLENGYEATSVRNISQKVGCEVGLVYYYFKTKDELFECALSVFYAQTEDEMRSLSEEKSASVENFIQYLEKKGIDFRNSFAQNVHDSVRSAVREKITSFAEQYLTAVLEKLKRKDAKITAMFVARGICGAVLNDDPDYYKDNKDSVLRLCKTLIGTELKETVTQRREIPSFLL